MSTKAYAKAGVDVDLGNSLKANLAKQLSSTHGQRVLGKAGGFGGLFSANFPEMQEPVLVSSIDGVGTKLKLAFALNKHDTIGQDLVNHCVNDIAVLGADPLFFLDYLGTGKLEQHVFREVLKGLTKACREAGCSLIGGETAQMPGIYNTGEYDLAGCIVGVVDRENIIDGSKITAGDVVIGLPGDGLHTNGYSLARKVFFEEKQFEIDTVLPGLQGPLGAELLRIHPNYHPIIKSLLPLKAIKGAAHITGGGIIDNIPRILPENCDAIIDTKSWSPPAIFKLIAKYGKIDPQEMYQVFNMGVGMVLISSKNDLDQIKSAAPESFVIGEIAPGEGETKLI